MKRISPLLLVLLVFVFFATLACICSNITPREALIISPDWMSDGQVGIPYEVTISISQNSTPANDIYVSDGALPPGLELVYIQAQDNATISGTPSEAGTFEFTISVSCFGTNQAGQSGEKQYSITIAGLAANEEIKFEPELLPDGKIGEQFDEEISISENFSPAWIFQVNAGALPPGLKLEYVEAQDTASITGIPTEAGTFTFTILVECFGTNEAGQTGEKQYSISVKE